MANDRQERLNILVKNTVNSLNPSQKLTFNSLNEDQQARFTRELINLRGQSFGHLSKPPNSSERAAITRKRVQGALEEHVPAAAMGVIEGATLGIPRIAIEKTTGMQVPRGNIIGQIAGFAAFPGRAVPAGVTKIPKIGTTAKLALGGLLEGAIFPQEGLSQSERFLAATAGALFGTGTGIGLNFLKAFKQTKRAKQALRRLDNAELKFRGTQESVLPAEIQKERSFLENRKTELLAQESQGVKRQVSFLRAEINKEAQKQAKSIKEPLVKFMRSFRDDWGNRLDEAITNAPEQGITLGEVNKMANETVEELIQSGVDPQSPTIITLRKSLNSLTQNLRQNVPIKQQQLLSDVIEGKKAPVPPSIEDTVIPNRDLLILKRNNAKALSPSARRAGQFTEGDLAAVAFNKRLSSRLAENIDELKPLNKEYKEFSDLAKFSYKNFTPKGSEYEITQGTRFFKRFADGKLNNGEKAALARIERETGIKFSRNLGKLENQLTQISQMSESAKTQFEAQVNRRLRQLELQAQRSAGKNKHRSLNIAREKQANKEIIEDFATIRNIGKTIAGIGAITGGFAILSKLGFGPGAIQALDAAR